MDSLESPRVLQFRADTDGIIKTFTSPRDNYTKTCCFQLLLKLLGVFFLPLFFVSKRAGPFLPSHPPNPDQMLMGSLTSEGAKCDIYWKIDSKLVPLIRDLQIHRYPFYICGPFMWIMDRMQTQTLYLEPWKSVDIRFISMDHFCGSDAVTNFVSTQDAGFRLLRATAPLKIDENVTQALLMSAQVFKYGHSKLKHFFF